MVSLLKKDYVNEINNYLLFMVVGILFGRKGEIKQTRFNFISYLPYC